MKKERDLNGTSGAIEPEAHRIEERVGRQTECEAHRAWLFSFTQLLNQGLMLRRTDS